MVLDLSGGLFKQSDVRETAVADLTSGQRVPIGCILAWLKNFAGTPSIPSGFVECNGQVLNDAESVFDGETIPALNNNNRFLRGNATSGGTGGSSTHTLITNELPSHTHPMSHAGHLEGTGGQIWPAVTWAAANISTGSAGGGAAHENKPPYYNIVWIMRIK